MRVLSMATIVLAATGCIPCGGASCGTPDPIRSEMLVVDLYEDERVEDLSRTDVTITGDLEVRDGTVVLIYTDVDGNTFQVTWERSALP